MHRQDDFQAHRKLEDEMSRFEEEISGHTIDRTIIGTKTFHQANRTIQDGHETVARNSGNYGHNRQPPGYSNSNFNQGDGGFPIEHSKGLSQPSPHTHSTVGIHGMSSQQGRHNMNHEQATTNIHMNNTFRAPHNQQFPAQQVPFPMPPMPPQIPSQFRPGMQQNIMGGNMVPMVPPSRQKAAVEHVVVTPEQKREWESAYANNDTVGGKAKKKDKKFVRLAGGVVWEDTSLADWDPNDFRIFVGDLGNEVTDDALTRAFAKYPSFQKAKVVREKKTNKTKGYGFVSFKDSGDFIKAMREMNGKYVGNRPIKLRKSTWKDRSVDVVKKKMKEKKKLGLR